MGGLFSSDQPKQYAYTPKSQNTAGSALSRQWRQEYQLYINAQPLQRLSPQNDSYFINTNISRPVVTPVASKKLVPYILRNNNTSLWSPMPMDTSTEVIFVRLTYDSSEYQKIAKLFKNTNKHFFKINYIERVQNPYLYGMYLLKKEELQQRHHKCDEVIHFHGTKEHNTDSICEENFDWRRCGQGTGHRFGRGVSFSPISNYATYYCDKDSKVQVMFAVNVLISKSYTGNADMVLPPAGFDTTHKPNGQVVVKYSDNEFYPAYKIYFTRN